jgi:hypothetical protein
MAGMDSKPREVSLNPVEDVEIFRLGVGLHNIIGPFTGREKEKTVKFVKKNAEKNASKSMDNQSRSSEVEWSIICSQTPISTSEFIPGEAKPDENHVGQEVWLERKDPYKPQCDGRDNSVDSMDKEKSIIPFTEAESTTGDHHDRCNPHRMGGNTFIYQTFQFPQSSSSNSNQQHFISSIPIPTSCGTSDCLRTVDEDYVFSNEQQTRIGHNTHGPLGIPSSPPQREGLLHCSSLF